MSENELKQIDQIEDKNLIRRANIDPDPIVNRVTLDMMSDIDYLVKKVRELNEKLKQAEAAR